MEEPTQTLSSPGEYIKALTTLLKPAFEMIQARIETEVDEFYRSREHEKHLNLQNAIQPLAYIYIPINETNHLN
jgi:hypothetical protein